MANLRNRQRKLDPQLPKRRFKVTSPRDFADVNEAVRFVSNLNKELGAITDEFDKFPPLDRSFDPNDYVKQTALEDLLTELDEIDAARVTAEGEDDIGRRRGRRASRRRRSIQAAVEAAIQNAIPTTAPPEVEDVGAVGTTDFDPGPVLFALSDHTHSGVNLSDIQDINARKDFLGGLFAGTTDQFRVGTDGDLDRIKDVPYSWPAANVNGVLLNDGAGNLSWTLDVPGLDADTLDGIDSTGFFILAGQAGGQTGIGGTASGNDLIFRSNTSDDGHIILGNSITATDSVVIHGTETGVTISGGLVATRLAIHDQEAADANLVIHKHNNTGAVAPTFLGARTRGTEASESVVSDNDVLLRILALGHDGTDFERAAQIHMEVDDASVSGTSMGGAIVFSTTPDASVTLAERWRIGSNGELVGPPSGDGVIRGSQTAGDSLVLWGGTPVTNTYQIELLPTQSSTITLFGVLTAHNVTMAAGHSVINAICVSEHGSWLVQTNLASAFGLGGRGYVFAPFIVNDANRADMGLWSAFLTTGNAVAVTGTTISAGNTAMLFDAFNVGDASNAGTLTWTSHTTLLCQNSITAGTGTATLDTRRGVWYKATAGTPANSIALDIGAEVASTLTAGVRSAITSGTGKWCLLSTGSAASSHVGAMIVGGAASTVPTAQFDVHQTTINSEVTRFQSTTSGSPAVVSEVRRQGRVTTTDATVTTLMSYTLTAARAYLIEARVTAHRTGGAAGAADDSAAYIVYAGAKHTGGVAALITAVGADYTDEDQAGWNATIDVDGANAIRVRVTGAANNNITWHCTLIIQETGT